MRGKGIPVPENDWVSLNVRFEDMDKIIQDLKGVAVTSDGITINEWDKLNKAARSEVKGNPIIPPTHPPGPTPPPPTPPPPTPPPPGPGPVLTPDIKSFSIDPMWAAQSTIVNIPGYCETTSVTIQWMVTGADTITLVRTGLIAKGTLDYILTGYMGTKVIVISQETSFLLKAENAAGMTVSQELTLRVSSSVPPGPTPPGPTPPGPTPPPQTLLPPANLAGSVVSNRLLVWTWTEVTNTDRQYYQLYASKTPVFDPDANSPADMMYRITFGNQTSIVVGGAAETWYGKVRQVAKSGKSAFTEEVPLTST